LSSSLWSTFILMYSRIVTILPVCDIFQCNGKGRRATAQPKCRSDTTAKMSERHKRVRVIVNVRRTRNRAEKCRGLCAHNQTLYNKTRSAGTTQIFLTMVLRRSPFPTQDLLRYTVSPIRRTLSDMQGKRAGKCQVFCAHNPTLDTKTQQVRAQRKSFPL